MPRHLGILLGAIADRLAEMKIYDAAGKPHIFDNSHYPPLRGCTIASAAMHAWDLHGIPPDMGRKATSSKKVARAKAIPDMQDLLRPGPVSLAASVPEGYETRIFRAIDYLNTP